MRYPSDAIERMRNLVAALFLVVNLNTLAQQPGPKALSSPQPAAQVRQEFLRAYSAKDVDAVVALYAEDAPYRRRIPCSHPLLRGEVTEARIGIFGSSSVLGEITPRLNLFLKLRVTNEHQGLATFNDATVRLTVGTRQYTGQLLKGFTRGGSDPTPNLFEEANYLTPIRHGVASVGWLHFQILNLERPIDGSSILAHVTVILTDEFDTLHEISNKELSLR